MAESLLLEPKSPTDPNVIQETVERISRRVAPLWDLPNMVAVNPFLGLSSMPIAEAARIVGDAMEARVLPSIEVYRDKWAEGAFGLLDIERAANRQGADAEAVLAVIEGRDAIPERTIARQLTLVERIDPNLNEMIVRSIARWCAVYLTDGGDTWKVRTSTKGLFASWLEAARVDRSVEMAGVKHWRKRLAELPETPGEVLSELLPRMELPASELEGYFDALLLGLNGWASYLRRQTWETGQEGPGAILDLLAIRVAADHTAASGLPAEARSRRPRPIRRVEDEATRLVSQEAWEDGFVRSISTKFNAPADPATKVDVRPAVQAVFCIDVRSERIRRRLEEVDTNIETMGFAGFFGVPLNWSSEAGDSSRCPVLLKPNVSVRCSHESHSGFHPSALKSAPGASFSYVELLGPMHGPAIIRDSLSLVPEQEVDERKAQFHLDSTNDGGGIEFESQCTLARGILKNIGLRKKFGRLILLCGHEGRSANNPQAAGLHCGACGGHGGALNARVAAAILNSGRVRERLAATGWAIPQDTWFVAGVHDTSTDEVELLDVDRLPLGHAADLRNLTESLARAGALTRAERAEKFGLKRRTDEELLKALRRRSFNWSEVRPEWALARNAAFIAARRSRTKGANLDGRTFLHEYDRETDPDGSILALILAAPMVVASWINLQYFASTVDNTKFGAGHKALHNRVGSLGVVLGNGGDLQTGLSLQSVVGPDGKWFHEPLRLQVFIEADTASIDQALETVDSARNLVENGWVRLFALHPDRPGYALRLSDGGWEEM